MRSSKVLSLHDHLHELKSIDLLPVKIDLRIALLFIFTDLHFFASAYSAWLFSLHFT